MGPQNERTLEAVSLPDRIVEPYRSVLSMAVGAWRAALDARLVSVVLFGSVARGTPGPNSDLDILIVARDLPRPLYRRRAPLLEAWERRRAQADVAPVTWSLIVKTPEEAAHTSPLYLDMVEDAVLLVDEGGFFAAILRRLRERMLSLGSRRIFLEDGSWYWDLKPGMRYGEVVSL